MNKRTAVAAKRVEPKPVVAKAGEPKAVKAKRAEPKAFTAPRSVNRLLGLFQILAKDPEGLTLAELSVALSSPKSSLLTVLRPLVGNGTLVHEHARYRLGPFMYRLAADILSTRDFPRLMRPYLEKLAARTGESIYLSVLDRETQTVSHIDGIDSGQAVRYASPIGSPRPLYCTAAGLVLLAFQDEKWREGFVKSAKLKRMTPKTVVDRATLSRNLAKIRNDGIAVSMGQLNEGAAGVAAPIYAADGQVSAALVIAAPVDRLQARLPEFQRVLADTARDASGVMRGAARGERVTA